MATEVAEAPAAPASTTVPPKANQAAHVAKTKPRRRRAPVVREPRVKRVPTTVHVQIATSPARAVLFVEGRRVENPYYGTARGGGTLRVTARAPGYRRRQLDVKLDRDRALAITLPRIRRK